MSCQRHAAALADLAAGGAAPAELERHLAVCANCRAELAELRAALALAEGALGTLATAEPSSDLRARIRLAVAAEADTASALGRFTVRWALAAGSAALVLAVLVAAWGRGSFSGGARTAVATVQATPPVWERTLSGQSSPSAAPAVPARRLLRAAEARPVRPARRSEPEVLVSPGQEEALAQLVTLAHRPEIVLPALAAAGEPTADLPELADIDIRPLEIVPLDPAEASGT